MIVILFGPPGSGKGTQAQNLEVRENFLHISTGDLLRDAVAKETELGKSIKEILASGQLVSNEIVALLLKNALHNTQSERIVLDGFPRTVDQVKILDDVLVSLGKNIDFVISLEVDSELLVERITGRFSCKDCGAGYHRAYKKTILPNVCDICSGSHFFIREDDNASVITKRIDVYNRETFPILAVYRQRGLVQVLDGSQNPDEVFKYICSSIKDSALNSV